MSDSITFNQVKVKPQERPETNRNLKLFKFYSTGKYTKTALGRMFKLSRERVRKIIETYETN